MIDFRTVSAVANLKHTYLSIGLATEGARKIEQEGSVICVSRRDHPVGNFAVVEFCDDLAAKELALYAGAKDTFHVYVAPPANSNGSATALSKRGFRSVHSLQIMWVQTPPEQNPIKIELVRAESNRNEIATYMAEQFFSRRGQNVAASVAEATAGSGLGLFDIRVGHDRIGVVMLSETETAMGIYNLVVAPNLRKKGYGTMILRAIREKAQKNGQAVTLQCEKALSSWYRGNDFDYCGEISVYVLEQR